MYLGIMMNAVRCSVLHHHIIHFRVPWEFNRFQGFQELSTQWRFQYLKWLEQKLCITNPLEWYEVANVHLGRYKGIWASLVSPGCQSIPVIHNNCSCAGSRLSRKGRRPLIELLEQFYPNIVWNSQNFGV
jgi:hypothetical protein